ncbi:Asp-tRNA(Asn)/Glu-tRNA(Gln) amidotransferase subunit GatC [Halocatena halophila]|uniref:Asp-tRNA(Asn)/Glu-tRNA(Gln) amidotransferase subunit GatC n=1 Tax=Halocatena halophila TaxID=2814576 RepID=UPI002ED2716D
MTTETVNADDVRHVADLARIDLEDAEIELFEEQFAEILEYFDSLDEVPAVDADEELVNVMRSDEPHESLSQATALKNAPETDDDYFKGPRVS